MQAYEVIDRTPVFRVPAPQPKPLAAFCFVLFGLLKIRKIEPDVIHAHELLSPTDMVILAKKIWGTPVIVKVLRGGKLGDLYKLNRRAGGKMRIQRLKANVDLFLAISSEIRAELKDEGIQDRQCRFLPNGVDIDEYKPVNIHEKKLLRRNLDLPQGFICVFSGRLSPEKGLGRLLTAWEEVLKKHPDACLLILGSGEMESGLRGKNPAHVILKGYVPETKPYYQASDAFILPSETEGLSNAMLEAMACALPVIVTRVGAAADIIDDQNNGLLVDSGQPEQISKVVDDLISHPQKRARLGKNGMEKVCREYSLDATVEGLAGLYREMAGMRKHS
jgi:glycosyltransferase involved in cell wall biosynthesis